MNVESLLSSGKTKQEIAYEEIKTLILNNKLLPGTVLLEQKLSDLLGISRTPVRAALRDLANENYITFLPGIGTVVSQIRIEDLIEIYEIREVLDVLSIRIFLNKDDKEILEEMKQHLKEMKKALGAGNYSEFVINDMAFHDCYLKNTGNSRLEHIMASLHEQIRRFLSLTASDAKKCNSSYNDHVKVMDAIDSKEYEKAAEALREHIVKSKEYHIKRLLKI